MEGDYLVVLITAADAAQAERIATALVEESLAACVNVVPGVRSIYRWKGELVRDDEALLLAKTTRARFEALQARVHALHTYDVPEVVALESAAMSEGYARFLADTLG